MFFIWWESGDIWVQKGTFILGKNYLVVTANVRWVNWCPFFWRRHKARPIRFTEARFFRARTCCPLWELCWTSAVFVVLLKVHPAVVHRRYWWTFSSLVIRLQKTCTFNGMFFSCIWCIIIYLNIWCLYIYIYMCVYGYRSLAMKTLRVIWIRVRTVRSFKNVDSSKWRFVE